MIIMNNIKSCPEGSEDVLSLLSIFSSLKREQIVMFLMQTDDSFNRKRAENIINKLQAQGLLTIKNECCSINDEKPNMNIIDAFWVLLHYVDSSTKIERGKYPAEIIFMKDNVVSEIIVCAGDILTKMDFLSKRFVRKTDCHYYILTKSDTIEELDDELYPETPFSIITISGTDKKEIPKMVFHNVIENNSRDATGELPDLGYEELRDNGGYGE